MHISDLAAFDRAMLEISEAIANLTMREPRGQPKPPTAAELTAAFNSLKQPLIEAREAGSGINPWALAGVKTKEVQNCSVLAGLWSFEFGGAASRSFLAAYLKIAVPDVDWENELSAGYRVGKEINPLGETVDRVDIIIETSRYLIAIEAKINAAFEATQMDRYLLAIQQRSFDVGKSPIIMTLTRLLEQNRFSVSTRWKDVFKASQRSVPDGATNKSFQQNLILSFGYHVSTF